MAPSGDADGPENGWLDGQTAVLTRGAGKGRITYIGALLDRSLMQSVMESMAKSAGIRGVFGPVPDDVEVCRRTGGRGDVFVLINHDAQPQTVTLARPMRDLLTGGPARSSVTLARQGVAPAGADTVIGSATVSRNQLTPERGRHRLP